MREASAAIFVDSSRAFLLTGDEAGDGRVADEGKGVCDGEGNGQPLLSSSEGGRVADDGMGTLNGESKASSWSSVPDSGSGIWEGESADLSTCGLVSVCGDVSFGGSKVHSQCRLLRFLRISKVGFRRFCILSTLATQSLMAAARI